MEGQQFLGGLFQARRHAWAQFFAFPMGPLMLARGRRAAPFARLKRIFQIAAKGRRYKRRKGTRCRTPGCARTAPQPLAQITGGEAGFAGGFFEGVELGLELGSFGGELAELSRVNS